MMIGKYDNVMGDRLTFSESNEKVGNILGINLLAGSSPYIKKNGDVLTTLIGTCRHCEICEKECYARRYTLRMHNVCLPAYIKNTKIMRGNLQNYVDQIAEKCKKAKQQLVRYHESGEFEGLMQMIGVEDVAIRVPEKRYYFYTREFDYVETIERSGGFSENVTALMSIWYDQEGKRNYDNPYNYPEFIYDDGSVTELDRVWHCPAVFIDGTMNKKIVCEKCGRCPNAKKGVQIAVYAHGKTKWHRDGVDVKAIAEKQKARWKRGN